eukprot:10152649-Lingulodinium_polyedra.AAC.1
MGNIPENLRALMEKPQQSERVTYQIQQLLLRGDCTLEEVVMGVKMLQQVPWAIVSVEQAHASVSL